MIAARPPDYWPGLAYFALIQHAERFVLADTFQYSRQSFQNRARLRNPTGWQWISVPLKGGQHGLAIRDVCIRSHLPWRGQHRRALLYNYGATPFYSHYAGAILDVLDRDWRRLGDLTCTTVEVLCDLLSISTPLLRASALPNSPVSLPQVLDALGDHRVLTTEAAARHDAPHATGLKVFRYEQPAYTQSFGGFESGMSILDLLFLYGPEARTILEQGGCLRAFVKEDEPL